MQVKISDLDLVEMNVDLSSVPDVQIESTVFDFIIEHVKEADVCRFKDVSSVLKWLHADYTFQHDQNHAGTGSIIVNTSADTRIEKTLRPGAIITIPKPRPNDMKFSDIETLQAYLNKRPFNRRTIIVPSLIDDSEDVDVTTYDFTPPWNQYAIVEPVIQNRQNTIGHIRVLTETQPKATAKKSTHLNKMPKKCKPRNTEPTDERFQCRICGREYKRIIYLRRHEDKHLEDKTVIKSIKNNSRKRPHNQKSNGITLMAAEIIST